MCISILHTPGDDPTHYEQASERWSPVQSVEKVILSVISMLAGINKFLISIFCFLLNIFSHLQNQISKVVQTSIVANYIAKIMK